MNSTLFNPEKIKLLLSSLMLVLVLCCTSNVMAQDRRIEGKVLDESGSSIIGATVIVKEIASVGSITDINGSYVLNLPTEAQTLIVTSIGYVTQEIAIGNKTVIDVTLSEDVKQLNEVVVTALGVERESKALGYSVQEVQGDDMTEARETNMVSGLSGKVAGLQVTNSGSTIGGSARVTIRGESSLNINANQPLFIVDGIPISNQVQGASGNNNLEVDYGNAAGEINPDDIASVSVLKGPAAAALYGSRAANGAILITTKSGKGKKGLGISINSNTTFENPLRLPDWQNTYGQGNNGQFEFVDGAGSGTADGVDESWGPKMDGQLIAQFDSPRNVDGYRGGDLNAPAGSTITPTPWSKNSDNIDEFFQTGVTLTNSIAITSANDFGNVRLSYTNLDQKGMVPNTDLKRNTLALNTGINITDKLKVNAAINYINTESGNRPAISYGTESLMYLWIWYGRQINTSNLREYWMPGMEGVQQFNYNYNYHDNPYFTTYENTNGQSKDRVLGNVSATYKFTDELSLMIRTGTDFYNELRDRKRAFSTQRFPVGMYREDKIFFNERNSDFLLTYNKTLNQNFAFTLSAGGNQMKQVNNYNKTVAPQLLIPGIYNFSNSAVNLQAEQTNSEKRINSFYGYGQFAYKNMLFLDITGRNDWSSTLPADNNSYFYPSATLSAVVSDMFQLPSVFSFMKVRAAFAQVGNDTNPYSLTNVFVPGTAWGSTQAKSESSTLANSELKPERTSSYEFGADFRFFKGRLGMDFTYYDNRTRDQIIPIAMDISTGYNSRIINAGEIQNNGIELMMTATPIKLNNGLNWDINVNFTRNRSKVIELADGLDAYTLTESNGAYIQAREGERMGNIYGVGFARVEDVNSPYYGQIIHSAEGTPLRGSDLQMQGNYNPDWMMGIQNTLSFKGLSLGFLFDIRQGGIVVSRTKTIGSTSGQLKETLNGRENGLVSYGVISTGENSYEPNDVVISARNFNNRYYERNNVEAAKYDASYVKLREVKLSYAMPQKWFTDLPVRSVKVSIVGRNLALWTENPHFDPDVMAMSGGTLQPGIENMAYPSARSYGFNININL
ncbi:SusC/RagA family TonB-linked outer membrane protein [Reichenbachiella agarivorans]|uniref:SusC/RagA family TonB-linked outer membrane protein n=1 Tax=Reichenbachiella agarivorans TaxID=2979464 RepID=A0ABY6CNW8_9BACT|nr:SusC/RagA family TonB-linked outer membrane protein [Reichenbachiella agarivorans]UXP32216.1 SusC/RagA family TonB-linked outer membrane protein [Reichenbachiella agarivorans]